MEVPSHHDEIAECLRSIHLPGEVFELRILGVLRGRRRTAQSGFFSDPQAAAVAAKEFDIRRPHVHGIYATVNPLNPALLARSPNKVSRESISGASDSDVTHRRWMFVDLDPIRPSGVSASDVELNGAIESANLLTAHLTDAFHWPKPLQARSGNGCHLLYRIDLPNSPSSQSLIRRCLAELDRFLKGNSPDGVNVSVDQSVHNAARIIRVYGTTARKGAATADRPHRISSLVKFDGEPQIVTLDQLLELGGEETQATAELLPPTGIEPIYGDTATGEFNHKLKVAEWLQDYGRGHRVKHNKASGDRTVYLLEQCPFNGEHGSSGEVSIMQDASGAMAFHCMHNSCSGYGWQDARDAIGKPQGWHYDPPMGLAKKPQRIAAGYKSTAAANSATAGATTATSSTVAQPPGMPWSNAETVGDVTDLQVIPLAAAEVLQSLLSRTNGWPKRCGDILFTLPEDETNYQWIKTPEQLFAWAQHKLGVVDWRAKPGCVTKAEFFAGCQQQCEAYEAVESIPHWPPVDGVYYPPPIKSIEAVHPSINGAFFSLINRFTAASPEDSLLLASAFLTLFWGGSPGSRPVFVITALSGRGAGKSSVAEMMANLVGGQMDISPGMAIDEVHKRILSPEGLRHRLCRIDNLKSPKFSWGEFEGLITAEKISGRRLYGGETQRPNRLCWVITVNGVHLSTDLAQRSVIIRLGKPEYSPNWRSETKKFIAENRMEILSEIKWLLQSQPAEWNGRASRWAYWESEILNRLAQSQADLDAVGQVLDQRVAESDSEGEELEMVQEFFERKLKELSFRVDCESIHDRQIVRIRPQTACQWWIEATGNKSLSTRAVGLFIGQAAEERPWFKLKMSSSKNGGRHYLWTSGREDWDGYGHKPWAENASDF